MFPRPAQSQHIPQILASANKGCAHTGKRVVVVRGVSNPGPAEKGVGVEEDERGQCALCRPQRTGAAVVAREGGRAAMVAQAHKREGVRSHLQCLSFRASGSCPLGHLEDNSPSGHDSVSPLCVIC